MVRALFAGSFDPPTLGHLDIIKRAAKLFDELFVGIAINTSKTSGEIFSTSERKKLLNGITREFPNVKIESFSTLTLEFAKKMKIDCLIRGIRHGADLSEEYQLALANRRLTNIETLFLLGDPALSFISSTLIKEIASFKGPLKDFVPPKIEEEILKKLCR